MSSDRNPAGEVELEGSAWNRFWFTPIPLTGLHVLRVLSGILFCAWLLSFVGHQRAFFSLEGWFDTEAYFQVVQKQREQINIPLPPLGWSILYLANSHGAFLALYWGSIAVLALFTLGVATRLTSILTWVVVVSFYANPATSYEGDYLLGILAFYLMLAYSLQGLGAERACAVVLVTCSAGVALSVGNWLGLSALWLAILVGAPYLGALAFLLILPWNDHLVLAERLFGARRHLLFGASLLGKPAPRELPPSYAANLVMRLLQIHVAIIVVTSGLHKLQMGDWWAGVAFWYPLHPPFQTTPDSLERERGSAMTTLFVLSLAQYLTLAWQIGFPLFAWRTGRWRAVLLGGAAVGWLGAFFMYKLPLFGPFLFIGALSYLTPREWAWLGKLGQRIVGGAASTAKTPAETHKPTVLAGSENIKKV